MPTLKVLSWNIENFGKKTRPTNYIEFISTVIDQSDANIVGIMEVRVDAKIKNGTERLFNELINQLNSLPSGKNWDGIISDPSFDSHHEQYFYLWDESSMKLEISDESFRIPGILSDLAFEGLGLNTQDEKNPIRLLEKHHYVLKYYWLNRDLITQLDNGASYSTTPSLRQLFHFLNGITRPF